MHASVHIVASVLVLPWVSLAGMVLLVGEVARTKALSEVLDVAAQHALWILEWGIYVAPAPWLLLAAAGCFASTRRLGAAALTVLALGSLAIIAMLPQTPMDAGQWLFLAPCVIVAATSLRLFRRAGTDA